ncbi:MAG: SIMPL domain-containing protein [Flavobacteriaceae bacterium]|nr:SIMPL domain-containing protein [Flavobacteriaceae bacterium]
MKKLFLLLTLLVFGIGFGQEKQETPILKTQASFTTEVIPDRIYLGIQLSESDTKGRTSLEHLELQLKKVLENNQVDLKKQLTLGNLSSNFRKYFLKKQDVHKTKYYELVLYTAPQTSKILRELAQHAISNVRLLKTEYSKLEALKIELKGKAAAKAKKQAESMMAGLGQKLGLAIYVSDMQTQINPLYAPNTLMRADYNTEAAVDLDVDFDKLQVQVSVTVHFDIGD